MLMIPQNLVSHLSLTTDIWSDPNLASFMAITVHYCACYLHGPNQDHLHVCSHLLAFYIVDGKHDGDHMAQIFFNILKANSILGKVPVFFVFTLMQLIPNL